MEKGQRGQVNEGSEKHLGKPSIDLNLIISCWNCWHLALYLAHGRPGNICQSRETRNLCRVRECSDSVPDAHGVIVEGTMPLVG
jgi:hypothetical protein